MEHVLEEKEEEQLRQLCLPGREGDLPGGHADRLGDGVEEPDGRGLDGEVGEEDLFGALPLLLRSRDFTRLELPPPEVRDGVDDDPGDATTKVDDLTRYS
jgi:hypothetical protein